MSTPSSAAIARFVALAVLGLACGEADGGPSSSVGTRGGPVSDTQGAQADEEPPAASGPSSVPLRDGGADASTPAIDAGPPAVRFIGRFDTRSPAGPWCAWPGCRIVANFAGRSVSVKLNERVEAWMEGGPSEWDVAIDGALRPKLATKLGVHEYVLATGLPDGAHRVELYKRTEAQNGMTQFLGYTFADGVLLPPPPLASRRIEVVGDSQPAAFGIEGVGQGPDCPGVDWAARYQNFHKSFGARLGEVLGADVHGTVHSGKGLVRNIFRPDRDTMPLIYPRATPVDPTSAFDFTTFVPDVTVVMLGGNDFALGQPSDDGPLPAVSFNQATRSFVAMLRTHAPASHVFLVLSPSVTDDQPPGRASRTNVKSAFDTVAAERAASGDARVYSVAPPLAAAAELTGCNGHGSPAYHERLALQLATLVRAKTGWN